ncbi:MAG: hypothetical protein EON93_02435 [Burkholderiales bacterium]|nr:MAG: hypothetical protein EON93_02435 [Burkholderiales bacterium]
MAKPKHMECEEFYSRAKRVVDWFIPLNPYETPGSILKIEDINFGNRSSEFEPLFAYAISAKRYSLFNLDAESRPIIRKFSAHGLGHLMEPYPENDPAEGVPNPLTDVRKLGGKRWQYDFWYHVLIAALAGTPNKVRRDYHPALSLPALSRYGATSPAILRWMKHFNDGKTYSAQAKPFGFLVAPIARGTRLDQTEIILDNKPTRGRPAKSRTPKPIAPFERDPAIAASRAFDRESGEPIKLADLKSYAEALALYHVSSEDKFENAEPCDVGRTERRLLSTRSVRLIGKEANRVDETGSPDPVIPSCAEYKFANRGVAA